jgi:hypothetical protein
MFKILTAAPLGAPLPLGAELPLGAAVEVELGLDDPQAIAMIARSATIGKIASLKPILVPLLDVEIVFFTLFPS